MDGAIRIVGRLLSALTALLLPVSLFAHAVIDDMVKPAKTFQFISLRITHGCGTAATNKVIVKIPEGVTRVSPAYKPGWSVSLSKRAMKNPVEQHGVKMTETADTITWEGGPLPDGMYDVFQFRALLPDDEGGIYRFPTVQECVDGGRIRWIQVPDEGQSPWELEEPAPFIRLGAPVQQY